MVSFVFPLALARFVHSVLTNSYDYLFQLAIEMKKLGLPWESTVEPVQLHH